MRNTNRSRGLDSPSRGVAAVALVSIAVIGAALAHSTARPDHPSQSGALERTAQHGAVTEEGESFELVSLETQRIESAAPDSAADENEPQAAQPATGIRWARRDTDEANRSRILARQGRLRELLPIVRGEVSLDDEREYAGKAKVVAMMSIMVIFDAEGRSSSSQLVPGDPELGTAPRKPDFPHHKIASGGAWYMIPKGEFPSFDNTKKLMSEYSDGVPIAELPLDEVALLCERALSYQIP